MEGAWASLGQGVCGVFGDLPGLRTVIAGSAQKLQHKETKCKIEKGLFERPR